MDGDKWNLISLELKEALDGFEKRNDNAEFSVISLVLRIVWPICAKALMELHLQCLKIKNNEVN